MVIQCASAFLEFLKKVSGIQILPTMLLFSRRTLMVLLNFKRLSYQVWAKNISIVYSCFKEKKQQKKLIQKQKLKTLCGGLCRHIGRKGDLWLHTLFSIYQEQPGPGQAMPSAKDKAVSQVPMFTVSKVLQQEIDMIGCKTRSRLLEMACRVTGSDLPHHTTMPDMDILSHLIVSCEGLSYVLWDI